MGDRETTDKPVAIQAEWRGTCYAPPPLHRLSVIELQRQWKQGEAALRDALTGKPRSRAEIKKALVSAISQGKVWFSPTQASILAGVTRQLVSRSINTFGTLNALRLGDSCLFIHLRWLIEWIDSKK